MEINLNKAEQRLARYIAKCRYLQARANNAPDTKRGPQTFEQTDLEGAGAELAFCKAYNVYPDLDTTSYADYDAILSNGTKVDVKSTQHTNGHLLAVLEKKNKPADVYVLVVGIFPRYRIVGGMKAENLLQDSMIQDFGGGPCYAANQSQLEEMLWKL